MSGGIYRGLQRHVPRQRRSIVEYREEEYDSENEEDEDEDENEEQDAVEIEIEYDSHGEEIPIPCKLYDSGEEISIKIEYDTGDPELQQMLALAAAEEAENTDVEKCSSDDLEIEYETESEELFFDKDGNQITKRDMLLAAVQKIACPSPPREATPDTSPSITFLAIGEDMCEEVMRNICPDAKFLGIGRLDEWMYCVDETVEGVCCYRNILPAERQEEDEENEGYDTKESVVYGILWEVHESTIYTLLNGLKREDDPKYDMARVNVMRLSCENGFGPAFGHGWGLKRELREEGIEQDVLIFTGTPGGFGLGEGYNDEVNRGIVKGCMMGIPDEWVESDVRKWVKYPDCYSPIHPN
ncbi:hypothetical protein EYC80_007213 [Monilinia laxa]|uniref:Uncharacterized protein n=1 Tax=Monilinia laxa TaxID=61186 RepID=A0A5N6K0N6_MONLA|nr:hypothetical protein EYC80_007213 [Monilinia laxa]